ncbi:MAG TPA: TspO/MBR family protein [Candidatus Tyrphobacter sp.]|nr:TspO/MBR family protein [Candidatus Tyrphobacter sp.]
MRKSKNLAGILSLIVSLGLAYAVGFTGSIFTTPALAVWYASLVKPPLSPPDWIFAPVWTALYTLIAIAAWLIWKKRAAKGVNSALVIYGLSLVLNLFWSIFFFGLHDPVLGLATIILLLTLIIAITVLFYRLSKMAGLIFIPYLVWVAFATYLNLTIVVLNR